MAVSQIQADTEIICFEDVTAFCKHVKTVRRPAILRGFDIGSCTGKWKNPEYLIDKLGNTPAKVHVVDNCNVDKMDFRTKNFKYQTISMNDLIRNVFNVSEHPEFAFYLRWVGDDPRGQTKANFHQDFDQLSDDFELPKHMFFDDDSFFSSVLRISSPGIRVWTHYDIMDNLYVQIVGEKSVMMWDPNEAFNLYLDGDKSKVVDFQDPDLDMKYPKFKQAHKFIGYLKPGDMVFIPALWFHNMKAIDTGIAINIFWKNLNDKLYDHKDPYGNRDLLPAAKAIRMLDNVWHQLDNLPDEYRDFYGRQLIARIESKCLIKKDISQ